jgi:hypothetical protein
MNENQSISDNIEYLRELRAQLSSLNRPRNKQGVEVSAKIIREVIQRGQDAETRGYRFLLQGNDDAAQIREDILRAIHDHRHNMPRPANAPSRFAIRQGDAWLYDQLRDGDGRKRIAKLVRVGKAIWPPMLDPAVSDEAHIDRLERNRDIWSDIKWLRENSGN